MLPVRYSPGASWSIRYHQDTNYLDRQERTRVLESAFTINRALGYDVNAIDFAFKDGVLYAVDVTNPIPDFEVSTLTPYFFDWVVKTMADYAIRLALDEQEPVCGYGLEEDFQACRSMSCSIGSKAGKLPMRRGKRKKTV
jgi:hypothetical protein